MVENIFRGFITTILGAIMMCFAFYGWYEKSLSDMQALGAGIGGFALLFMRDKISEYVADLFKALINKISK